MKMSSLNNSIWNMLLFVALLMSGIVSADEQQKVEQTIATKQKQNIKVPGLSLGAVAVSHR